MSYHGLIACLAFFLLSPVACGDNAASGDVTDTAPDAIETTPDGGDSDDVELSGDVPEVDDSNAPDAADVSDVDTSDTSPDIDVGPPRPSTFRAIGGMSMGAAAINVALEHPGTFDMVGALGGYPDSTYMMAQMLRLHFQGFCPLADLAARADDLDNPNAEPPVTCGPALPQHELEVAMDFDHLRYDDNGITMTRGFYGEIIDNFSCAYGNLAGPSLAEAPLLPAGIDLAWWKSTSSNDRCANPKPIPKALSYNAEYNPTAEYPVIPLCDIDEPVTPGLLPSVFDVAAPRNRPIAALLAVDINRNGRRDLGEPLFLNPWERFSDVGADGCSDDFEDGAGGCIASDPGTPAGAVPPNPNDIPVDVPGGDPNGDNYDWTLNPNGTENNDGYDLGEPFSDLGLDGVSQDVSGAPDLGEGNGVWDTVPTFANVLAHDADTKLRTIDAADLEGMDFWFDAGIRDVLNAGVVARNLVATLRSRGREPVVYHDFTSRPGSFAPDLAVDELLNSLFDIDLSPASIGRDVYIEYGDPNADALAIASGDGKHVGSGVDAVNRIATFLITAIRRMPEPDYTIYSLPDPIALFPSFYSPALHARRGYTIAFPPGYWEPENAEVRYPVVYFLHGLGQDATDLAPAAFATGILMSQGRLPKALLVFPDGACCFVDSETGRRECACGDNDNGVRQCVDPACEGEEASCNVRPIPDNRLQRECHRGSLYADMQTNRWGEPRSDLGYKTSVFELVQHVDATYRVRVPTR